MTEKLLRDSLIEAQGKGEIGLFIWQIGEYGMIWHLK